MLNSGQFGSSPYLLLPGLLGALGGSNPGGSGMSSFPNGNFTGQGSPFNLNATGVPNSQPVLTAGNGLGLPAGGNGLGSSFPNTNFTGMGTNSGGGQSQPSSSPPMYSQEAGPNPFAGGNPGGGQSQEWGQLINWLMSKLGGGMGGGNAFGGLQGGGGLSGLSSLFSNSGGGIYSK